ncbi:mip18 family protein fam96a [Plakobranchus ocellatus]|uniref:Mip18 family protein fam96a n=1 Tax=Plakobranchus ocellatus TaxID=259542 RepID=A0AAV4AUP5_9GAST|nr:mip18 family protein fam96a [Plakobranchus ocellatus]
MEYLESSVDGKREMSSVIPHHGVDQDENENDDSELKILQETIYDLISDIKDPEKADSLEDLNVVSETGVKVKRLQDGQVLANIEFVPTVPHCTLASIIGLSIRSKLDQSLPKKMKIDIFIKKGTHDTAEEINKQINDKERISAAMENPNLQKLVASCIDPEDT